MNLLTVNTLPQTGEVIKSYGPYVGILILVAVIFFILWRRKKDKDENEE